MHPPSRRTLLRLLLSAGSGGGWTSLAAPAMGQTSSQPGHVAWVVECLERMLTVTPGMTRGQLLNIFTTEGGISTPLERTFVSRDCPYFKVTVQFRRIDAAGSEPGSSEWLEERDEDVITKVSGPFLAFSIMD